MIYFPSWGKRGHWGLLPLSWCHLAIALTLPGLSRCYLWSASVSPKLLQILLCALLFGTCDFQICIAYYCLTRVCIQSYCHGPSFILQYFEFRKCFKLRKVKYKLWSTVGKLQVDWVKRTTCIQPSVLGVFVSQWEQAWPPISLLWTVMSSCLWSRIYESLKVRPDHISLLQACYSASKGCFAQHHASMLKAF